MEYVGSTALLFMTMKVMMYGIPNGLLYEKSTIIELSGAGWGGGSPSFLLNPSIMAFSHELPFNKMSSAMFFPTCTSIIVMWWSMTIVVTMTIIYASLPSPCVIC
jgi:hypothetical protein